MAGWVKKHPEFAEAVEEADDAAEAWWIDVGRKGVMLGAGLLAKTYIFLMKNKWPKIYRDRQDHQITGANDGPIVRNCAPLTSPASPDPREAPCAVRGVPREPRARGRGDPLQTKH